MFSLFRDYPDLYQALAALSVSEDTEANEAKTIAAFSSVFRKKVRADIARLETEVKPIPLEAIADAAQWPEEDTHLLQARYREFITML